MNERDEKLYCAASAKVEIVTARKLIEEARNNLRIAGNDDAANTLTRTLRDLYKLTEDHFEFIQRTFK